MQRRDFGIALALLALAGCARVPRRRPSGPLLWRVVRRDARVYLLGAAEAKDRSWLTARIERAFADSTALWLETPTDPWPPALLAELGFDSARTFFEALEPNVRKRAARVVDELGIELSVIERMRPWYAYYKINAAFWSKYPPGHATERPDHVLRSMASHRGLEIHHEFASGEHLLKYFAAMSPRVQSQYIEMLLDYLDDEKLGLNAGATAWVNGNPSSRALDRMRKQTPELHRYLQTDRNRWWATQIDKLLSRGGVSFVLLGMNHVQGPEGVPEQLMRMRLPITVITS